MTELLQLRIALKPFCFCLFFFFKKSLLSYNSHHMHLSGFSEWTELCHHHYSLVNTFIISKKNLTPLSSLPISFLSPLPLAYIVCGFAHSRHFQQMALYHMQSFVTGFYHLIMKWHNVLKGHGATTGLRVPFLSVAVLPAFCVFISSHTSELRHMHYMCSDGPCSLLSVLQLMCPFAHNSQEEVTIIFKFAILSETLYFRFI